MNPVFSDHFWRLVCSKVWTMSGFLPLPITVSSSANKNPLTWLDELVITSFMAMWNRLTLRTDVCGTSFSMILDEERWFASLTWMVLVWRKFLMMLKVLFLIPYICRSLRIRFLHTICYTFSMSRHTTVNFCWLAKMSCISLSRLIEWS